VSGSLSLAAHQKIEPVLEGVLGPAFHELGDFGPLLTALEFEDVLEQAAVLLQRPWSLLDVGIEEAVPVFSALFGSAEDLATCVVALVKALRDSLPVDLGTLANGLRQQPRLRLGPFVRHQLDLLQPQPPEFTFLPSGA
jgi:hypothetical protein